MRFRSKVETLVFIREKKLTVTACRDGSILVSKGGDIRATFDEHNDLVTGLVKLSDDLVLSISRDGHLFSWRPSTGNLVGKWSHVMETSQRSCRLECLCALDQSKLIIGDSEKNLLLLQYDEAVSSFKKLQQAKHMHSDKVTAIAFHRNSNLVVTCSADVSIMGFFHSIALSILGD